MAIYRRCFYSQIKQQIMCQYKTYRKYIRTYMFRLQGSAHPYNYSWKLLKST
jgi:hypothetical protein